VVCDSNGDSDCGATDGRLVGRLSRVVLSFIAAAYPASTGRNVGLVTGDHRSLRAITSTPGRRSVAAASG
jgi:hypothetical protein